MSKYRLITQEELNRWNVVKRISFRDSFRKHNNINYSVPISIYFKFGKEFTNIDNMLIEFTLMEDASFIRLHDDFTYPIESFVEIQEEKPKKITHKIRNYV